MNLRVVIRTADLDTVARSDSLSVSLCLISRQGDMTEVVNFSSKVCPHKCTHARGTTHVHTYMHGLGWEKRVLQAWSSG